MIDRAIEEEHLRKAEADIAAARERIERQSELMTQMSAHGHDTTTAQELLQTMRETLAVMEQHREAILQELAR